LLLNNKSIVDIDNCTDNIRMSILSTIFQSKMNKIIYNNDEKEIQDYYYFDSYIK